VLGLDRGFLMDDFFVFSLITQHGLNNRGIPNSTGINE